MWHPANKAALPSQEETRYAKEAIIQLEMALKDAYELLEQAKTRVSKLVAELEERKAWIAPIRLLPVEILSEIFIFSSEIGHSAPVTITEVSRLWRKVTLATPRAWSRIRTNSPRHERHVISYLSTFIKRSDPCLLHIRLSDSYGTEADSEFGNGEPFDSVLTLLLSFLHRIKCLSIPSWQLKELNEGSMPNLTRLEIRDWSWPIDPFFITHSRFPLLRTIVSRKCEWADLPSFRSFPPLQHLSIDTDDHHTWLDVIRSCANTLKSLIVGHRSETPTATVTLPRLESLTINQDLLGQTEFRWLLRLMTPAVISYEEYTTRTPILGTPHWDLRSVKYLRSNRLLDLSIYTNLRVYWLNPPDLFVLERLAIQLATQLGRERIICPALQMIQFPIMDSFRGESKTESIKNGIMRTIGEARPSVQVVFTNHVTPMPGSMDEISCDPTMPCAYR